MRTTIRIDDELLKAAKRKAAETGRTLASIIEDALRLALTPSASSPPRVSIELTTFTGNGLQQGVDLDDSASLLDLMEGGNDPD